MSELEDEKHAEARERLALIHAANALEVLIQTEGWKLIFAFQEATLEKSRVGLLSVDTGDTAHAIAELQKWQIAEKMVAAQVDYINRTLEEARQLRGAVTLDDALLMEKMKNEQSQPAGDSAGDRPDPAGY